MSGDDLGALARDLASVYEGSASRRAAERVLSSTDPEVMLDRLYPLLMWHKCLGHALSHLGRAGGDLDRLSLSRRRFRSTFPVAGRGLWRIDDSDGPERIPLSGLASLLARHKRFLGDAVDELLEDAPEGVALLSGRALEAISPDYGGRMEFDSDLLARDVATGLDLLDRLAQRGYELRFVRARDGGQACEASAETRREGHSVTVGLEMGGHAALGGAIESGLGRVRWRGLDLMAPCPEDLLLLVAARARSQRSLQWIGVNDATVIVSTRGERLDWQSLCESARGEGLQVHLALLLECARRASPDTPALAEWPGLLALDDREVRLLDRLRAVEPWSPESAGRMSTGGLTGRMVAFGTRRSASEAERRPRGVGARFLARLAYRAELRSRRLLPAALAPLAGWLRVFRPRLGSLCELRDQPLDPEASFCLSARGRSRGELPRRLRALAERLPSPGRRPHDCYRFEYRL